MICYIILHYQVIEETVNCVNHLKKIDGDHKIIIVDNCSPNGTGKTLQEKFKFESDIIVILHNKNDGFARGNNIGCQFAREEYDPDFYVVMNNDVEIVQLDFALRLEEIWKKDRFDVLGPDIYSTTLKIHQNPKSLSRTTIAESKKLQMIYKEKLRSRLWVTVKCYLKQIPLIHALYNKYKRDNMGIVYSNRYFNVPLHGSCLIFSKHFIKKREYAFFPGTFFYYESEILDYECAKSGYTELYDPSIKVYHHQNVSTNETYKSEIKRVQFMNEQNYKSISAFLDEYGE